MSDKEKFSIALIIVGLFAFFMALYLISNIEEALILILLLVMWKSWMVGDRLLMEEKDDAES